MRISVLASSSGGNASVIAAGATAVMVDAGISARRLRLGLAACGVEPTQLQGVFITHEHRDHIAGLGQFTRKVPVPVFCSRYLRDDLRREAPEAALNFVEPGTAVQLGDLRVTPFSVYHDAADPFGFVFEHDGLRLGYLTDTGHVSPRIEALLEGVHILYLESNYDERMLRNSARPPMLKERIGGAHGHLSNTQAGQLVERLAHAGLRHVILGHMSSECNTPSIAAADMERVLARCAPTAALHTALRDVRLDWVETDGFFLES